MEASLFQAAAQGFQNLLDPHVFLAILLGVGIGTFTAVAPQGMGTPLAYSILLPIVARWNPITAIALLLGVSAVSAICAAYLPVLFGIPGGGGSAATILDGYPMGKRGEARRALGASFMAGGMGSLIGTFTLALAIPAAKPLIYMLGSPELFIVVLWGLGMLSVLSGDQPLKGLIAAAFGLLISTIGQQEQSGVMRFAFGQIYLLDGFSITIIALAMFGIPSALGLALAKMGVEQQPAPLTGSLLDGVKDTLREWWLVVRCSFVGVWVGIVPGIGSQTVDWLAYGHAVQSSKNKEMFGKGDVRGVIAPECANDAKDGGDLLTTLFLGLPQGSTTALFIVALLALGYVPGPEMVAKHLDVIFSAVWIEGIAGITGTLIGFALANQLAKLTYVRYSLMVPIILAFILMGAFSANRDPLDLLAVFCFGLLGFFMKRFGYPRPALILGVVLGVLMEKYLYRSVASYGFSWLQRPGVIVLLILAMASLIYSLPKKNKEKNGDESSRGEGDSAKKPAVSVSPEILFPLLLCGIFLSATFLGWKWPLIANLMPVYLVAMPGVVLTLLQIFKNLRGRTAVVESGGKRKKDHAGQERNGVDYRTEVKRTIVFFAWLAAGGVAIWLMGIIIALPLAIFFYSLMEGRERWWVSLFAAAGTFAFLWGIFDKIMDVRWPPGIIFS